MQQVKKEDQPKLIALVVLAVAVFGYLMWTSLAPAQPTTSAKVKPSPSPGAPGGTGTTVAANTGGPAPAGGDSIPLETLRPPTGGRDPFQPVGPPVPMPSAPPPAPQPQRPNFTPPVASVPKPQPKKRIPQNLGDLLGGDNPAKSGATPVEPVKTGPPPPPEFVVTGVILGDPTSGNPRNVAILRSPSGDERRFVSIGDPVGNGYTVAAVYADGIELKDKAGNRRVTIKLGQSGDRTRAKAQ